MAGLSDLALQRSVKQLHFDKFEERGSDNLEVELSVGDFASKVDRLSADFGLDGDVKQSILEGQYAEVNKNIIKRFQFKRGQGGNIVQGLVATRKRQIGTIDFGHVIRRVDFRLSPEIIHHKKKKKKCFGLMHKTKRWTETRPRSLSHNDEALLEQYIQRKMADSIDQLQRNGKGLILDTNNV